MLCPRVSGEARGVGGHGPAPLSRPHPAGILHEDLRLLLETSMPAKKKKALLGVADAKIGAAILEELGYQCQTGGVVAEILRGEWPGAGGSHDLRPLQGPGGPARGCSATRPAGVVTEPSVQGSACTSTRW